MENKNIGRFLALALLIGAGFVSGAVASPPQAPMLAAGCQKITQSNGAWIASVCPAAGKNLGHNVVGVDVYYWGYLGAQELPFGGATPTVQAYLKVDADQPVNTPLLRDNGTYFSNPTGGAFFYGRYLTAKPLSGELNLELYFAFNGQEDSDYNRNYRTVLSF
ncbi:MAG: hypothetical protein NTY45_08380 [Elusimicrobia bacterium]|nr:hypothetical protein [Elusimicrobiota bacterium]